jgi:hypothetical protein
MKNPISNSVAQEMLSTLKQVDAAFNLHFGVSSDEEGGSELHDQVRSAIAKAEGRTNA